MFSAEIRIAVNERPTAGCWSVHRLTAEKLRHLVAQVLITMEQHGPANISQGRLLIDCVDFHIKFFPSLPRDALVRAWNEAFQDLDSIISIKLT